MSADRPLDETQFLSLADIEQETEWKKITGYYFTLVVIEGADFGYIFQLEQPETVIGRKVADNEDSADIQINDDQASRRHLLITKKSVENDAFRITVTDLHSKNGTFHNGRRLLTPDVELHNGDKLQIGSTVLKFEIKDELSSSYHEHLYQQVTRDALTQLLNQNIIRDEIEKAIVMASYNRSSFSLILFEVDLFKDLNEKYGKKISDNLLRAVAKLLETELSDYASLARYNSAQFLALLLETEIKEATSKANIFRQVIENHDFSQIGCKEHITISASVAQFPICGKTTSELITNLNEVLHYAKQLGFNQVEVSKALKQQRIGLLHKTIRTAFVGLLLVVAVLCVGWVALKFYPKTEQQKLFSGVVEVHEIEVGSKVGGRVKEVLVQEGDIVKANQPIIRFDINELLAERKQAEARVEQAKAYLNKLLNGSRPEEIAQAEAAMRRELASLEQLRNGPRPQEVAEVKAGLLGAESDLQTAETIYQRLQAVFHTGYISKQDRDDAENTRNQAKARRDALQEKLKMLELGTRAEEIRAAEERYKQALANVQLLRSGTRKEDIADAQAKLMEAEAVVENLNVRIREGEVSSPVESKVEVIDVRPGDLLSPGRTVAKLLEKEQIWVRTYVPETELPRIRVGQQAIVTIDSLPNLHIEGHVKEINSEGEFLPRNIQSRNERKHQVFGVKVYIDNSQGLFKSGMSADITFLE